MSFSGRVKTELCKKSVQRPCCLRAACCGFACFAKYFDEKGVVLHTERALVAQTAQKLFRRIGVRGEVIQKQRSESVVYEFAVKDPSMARRLLAEYDLTGREPSLRIDPAVFACEACFYHFLSSAFLCCGTVADPAREYSLEFVSTRRNLMADLEAQLRERGFEPRRAQRRSAQVLYFKASEQVEDLLTAMGATSASLAVMEEKVYKELRNKANRITNCENANIDKIVAASGSALDAVRILRENQCFETLPEELKAVACLREEYPEYSLAELGKLLEPPLSRAGVCHRMKKLTGLAEEISKKNREQTHE
ncbi:DNA-binding protein WhiA [Anaerofilum sp. BX8]|uniref:Probable cell division protein WhiA n=1 Tax=Anaerofilum hominis TaxID=2763016 RepID=A0A923KUV0_9FIRM|nr:DNA-binding protein WhiA [Anaerofilum hominis]MBC5580086.1 DNA-binding protein WhiA [Anaerofilum hominis]